MTKVKTKHRAGLREMHSLKTLVYLFGLIQASLSNTIWTVQG